MTCHLAAARPPACPCAGHRPPASPQVRPRPGGLLYIRVVLLPSVPKSIRLGRAGGLTSGTPVIKSNGRL